MNKKEGYNLDIEDYFFMYSWMKLAVEPDGTATWTYAPPEFWLGRNYVWMVLGRKCAIAYDPFEKKAAINRYWQRVKPINLALKLRGTVVFFRHMATYDVAEHAASPLRSQRFSALKVKSEYG